MADWRAFPYTGDYTFDAAQLTASWARLHRGDAEPLPRDPAVLQAWMLFHNGAFRQAADAGLRAGPEGITVANKAASVHANYLENHEKTRLDLMHEIAVRAEQQQTALPANPNAWYFQAYALGRYAQGISVAKALAQGLGNRVKTALEKTIALSPGHADAHAALATFHAEVIDKVGSLIGGMTYGARKDVSLALFKKALDLNPDSAAVLVEYANGLVMLEGESRMEEATALYRQAAALKPLDATERLHVELARAELGE
ncbi:MAG: hypothetical protein Q7T87_20445 [Polaromonas sp.]|nr:hypothetical protein [Polaromonas sp.]